MNKPAELTLEDLQTKALVIERGNPVRLSFVSLTDEGEPLFQPVHVPPYSEVFVTWCAVMSLNDCYVLDRSHFKERGPTLMPVAFNIHDIDVLRSLHNCWSLSEHDVYVEIFPHGCGWHMNPVKDNIMRHMEDHSETAPSWYSALLQAIPAPSGMPFTGLPSVRSKWGERKAVEAAFNCLFDIISYDQFHAAFNHIYSTGFRNTGLPPKVEAHKALSCYLSGESDYPNVTRWVYPAYKVTEFRGDWFIWSDMAMLSALTTASQATLNALSVEFPPSKPPQEGDLDEVLSNLLD